jgi:plasmid replication initiation protein
VAKSNYLIEASYKLTLNEQRLVLAAIARVNPFKEIPAEIKLDARTFAETFHISEQQAYDALSEATDRLYERDIKTYLGPVVERFRWVSGVKYHKGEGFVTLRFTREIAPYLTDLRGRFTQYQLESVAGLGSAYSIRLFEMLMQWRTTGQVPDMPVETFRERMGIEPDHYPRFFDLKKRVIDKAVEELQEKAGIEVEWEGKKRGRNVTSLVFRFKLSEQMRLDLGDAAAARKGNSTPVPDPWERASGEPVLA